MRKNFFVSVLMVVTSFSASAATQKFSQKAIVNLEVAEKLADAAQSYAAAHGWPCSISIVDDGGWSVVSRRMDGAPVTSGVDLALGKARTSALFKRPSGALENAINDGRPAALTAGMVMMKGGQPVVVDKQVIGAIGISADTPAHDDEIAQAALLSLIKS